MTDSQDPLVGFLNHKKFMMKDKYESFDEWRVDFEKVRNSPNDQKFVMHVSERIKNSSLVIQRKAKDYLLGLTLESNPWYVFKEVAKAAPLHIIVVSRQDDPWFKV